MQTTDYLHNMSDDEIVEVLEISQNEAGIDTENRVEMAVEWYEKVNKTMELGG